VHPAAARCGACEARPPPFVRTVAALRYAAPVARMIQRVKFSGNRVDARVLGSLLGEQVVQAYRDAPPPHLITPVPLGRVRLLRRGHNQAALFARWVAKISAIPIDYDLCRRTRHTAPQTRLGRRARQRNLSGAFSLRRPVAGLRIAILDDVMTTAATVTSLARTLLEAGADEVHVWVVARTMEPQPTPHATPDAAHATVLLESPR
jgi:ComF family protein